MEQKTIDKLYEEFEIAIKPGQGFKYVRTRDILDRLNKTFEGNWGIEVKHHEMIGDEVLVLVSVHLYGNDGSTKATQEGFGSAKKFKNTELGNIYKSATSKAVKSAVRNWGVALFLDDENMNTQGAQSERSNASMPNMSSAPQSMPSTTPGPSQSSGAPTPIATNVPPKSTPSSTPNVAPSVPSGMPTETSNVDVPPPPSSVNPPNSGGLPTMSAVPGTTPTSFNMSDEAHNITAVQKVAITSRLGAKGLTFDQISEEFYTGKDTTAPDSIDGMLYVDALDMVAFLNTK